VWFCQLHHSTQAIFECVTWKILSIIFPISPRFPLQESVIPSADVLCLLDFGFSDFNMSQTAMAQAVVRMFLELNLLQDFNIDYKVSGLILLDSSK